VILTFDERYPESVAIGYDFSHGMLHKAQEKNITGRVIFVEGDAAELPFGDDSFDVVTCSHALYELKGETRQKALREMRRVVRPMATCCSWSTKSPGIRSLNSFFTSGCFPWGQKTPANL